MSMQVMPVEVEPPDFQIDFARGSASVADGPSISYSISEILSFPYLDCR
jgi:hypothetical protein